MLVKKLTAPSRKSRILDDLFGRANRHFFWEQLRLSHFLLCALVVALHLLLLASGRLERFENIALDSFFRQRPSQPVSPALAVIEIDKESLQAIGPWPWPWRYHAQLIKTLQDWGARAVVFDFLFKDPASVEELAELQKALEGSKQVYLPVLLERQIEKKIWIHGMPVVLEPEGEKKSWLHSVPEIEKNAAGIGHINLVQDADGTLRRLQPYLSYGSEFHLSLALKAGHDHLGREFIDPAHFSLPLDAGGHFLINWAGRWADTFEHYSYADLIRSTQAIASGQAPVIHPDKLKGKICVIGLTAPEISDLKVTPLESALPAVAVQAHVINSVLTGRYLKPASFLLNAVCLVAIGVAGFFLFAFFRNVQAFIAGLFLAASWTGAAYFLFLQKGLCLDTLHPLLLILALFIVSTVYSQLISVGEEKRLFDLATRDGLTGLFVIRHFREILNRAVQESQVRGDSLALILVDIDNFKKINDTYGHPAGDRVLKQTAERIAACFRSKRRPEEIDFVARYGGEEFIIMIRKAKLEDVAFKAAERLRLAVEKSAYEWDGQAIPVTISLGVSSLHPGESIPDLMVRRADEALYRAKRSGKNCVCVETSGGG